jgi:cation diffusion facilitator CzcD-associated flavoprotein CzcO
MEENSNPRVEHVDVLIVGAGLAGVGFAYHLQQDCPHKSYEIVDGRDCIGGTWDLFRYPGIRSDSDVHSYAYSFKPWVHNRVLGDGEEILDYIREAAQEHGIDKKIKFNHKVEKAEWDSKESLWRVEMTHTTSDGTEVKRIVHCVWLQICTGYYSYKAGYRPDFPNEKAFQGEIIHPQEWERDYDARGKKFIVIGSGATAVTLIPNLAKEADHVVMVQRSPSYIAAVPSEDPTTKFFRSFLPQKWAYRINRKKSVWLERFMFFRARNNPQKMTDFLLGKAREILPDGYDVEKHFLPNYKPWDQRMCMSPGGDLFTAIAEGKVSVATGHIETFTSKGLILKSGEEIEADVIVSATGLNVEMAGGVQLKVDGQEVAFPNTWNYKGAMFSGVPNMALSVGTLVATYTLRIELIAAYVCRLLNHMDKKGKAKAVPQLPMSANAMAQTSIFSSFSSGYVKRAEAVMPKQGDRDPWIAYQTFKENKKLLNEKLDDGILVFGG